ncbi:hypothetical protein [Haladaptatus sp. R4]|uniref:hypothetical protein n=1 Tax=Haladaptatus sp. R4 TaxID=1679489 RepID=UPI0016804D3A|nr:hypothetical protein [Haladaptatus sp. R4]
MFARTASTGSHRGAIAVSVVWSGIVVALHGKVSSVPSWVAFTTAAMCLQTAFRWTWCQVQAITSCTGRRIRSDVVVALSTTVCA